MQGKVFPLNQTWRPSWILLKKLRKREKKKYQTNSSGSVCILQIIRAGAGLSKNYKSPTCLRIWPNIKQTLGQCFVFADYVCVPSISSAFVHRVSSGLTHAHCFDRLAIA